MGKVWWSFGVLAVELVFWNGPAGVGKDEALAHLASLRHVRGDPDGLLIVKMSTILKQETHRRYGLGDVAADAFDAVKDEPMAAFGGLTPRQAYIHVSENILKPNHGATVLAELALPDIRLRVDAGHLDMLAVDCGFGCEAVSLWHGLLDFRPHVSLVRLIDGRPGRQHDRFAGDSRSYFDLPGVVPYHLENRFDAGFYADVADLVNEIEVRRLLPPGP